MSQTPKPASDHEEDGPVSGVPIRLAPVWQDLLESPYLNWRWLSPLMQEWTWQDDPENTQLREVLVLLRDDRLNSWQNPQREPGCILDALDSTVRAHPWPRRTRGGRAADAVYAASMPRDRRIVLATLHAARGFTTLLYGQRARLISHARNTGVLWRSLARDLKCSVPTARKACSHPAAALDLIRWQGSPLMEQCAALIDVVREYTDQQLANRTSGPTLVSRTADLTESQRLLRDAEESTLEAQLAWVEQPAEHRSVRASLQGVNMLLSMTSRVIEQLVYEARERRRATWDDIALALGATVQYAHKRYAHHVDWPGSKDVERGLRIDLDCACRVAAERLRSNTTPPAEQQAAQRCIGNYWFDRELLDRWRDQLDGLWDDEEDY